jgi:hypothetical protein
MLASAAGGTNNQGGSSNGNSVAASTMAAIAELAMAAGVASGTMNGNGSDSTKSDPTLSRSPSLMNFVNAPSPLVAGALQDTNSGNIAELRSASTVPPKSIEEAKSNPATEDSKQTHEQTHAHAVGRSGENSNNTTESGHGSATTAGTIESTTAERATPSESNNSSSSSSSCTNAQTQSGILGSWGWPLSS